VRSPGLEARIFVRQLKFLNRDGLIWIMRREVYAWLAAVWRDIFAAPSLRTSATIRCQWTPQQLELPEPVRSPSCFLMRWGSCVTEAAGTCPFVQWWFGNRLQGREREPREPC